MKQPTIVYASLFLVFTFIGILSSFWGKKQINDKMNDGTYPRVLFALMTHRSSIQRAITFHETYASIIKNSHLYEGPIYLSAPPEMLPNQDVLPLNKETINTFFTYPLVRTKIGNIDLTIKFISLLKYFLQNTSAAYVLRATDDVYINFDEFPQFLNEVLTKGDPYTTPIIIGHCMHVRGRTLLQGGSGFLISRKAAELIMLESDQLVASIDMFEDWVIYSTIQRIIKNTSETYSPRFIGHGFSKRDWQLLESQQYEEFPLCPKKFWTVSCQSMLYPLSKVVFFHQFGYEPGPERWINATKKVPQNLMWYQSWYYSRLCRMTGEWVDEEAVPANKADAIAPQNVRLE